MLSIGTDYVLNRSLLVGAMVQFDSMKQRSNSDATDVRGSGWMAGPYATVRVSENLFWQSRAAWGQSTNTVSPFVTYSDRFATERWLASSTLTGRWDLGAWSFRPAASVSYMEDAAQSYIDTFGVAIPFVKSRLGQAKAGPEVRYRFDLGGMVFEPHAGAQVIWNFAHDTAAVGFASANDASGPVGTRGRAELGLRAMTLGGAASTYPAVMTESARTAIPPSPARVHYECR
jgi:outer membrane autotransporter protein